MALALSALALAPLDIEGQDGPDQQGGNITPAEPVTYAPDPPTLVNGVVRQPIKRVSVTMPDPGTLDQFGRPVNWIGTTVVADVGYLRVYVGTTDVTYLRGVQTVIQSYQLVEPFSYGSAVIAFPQISPLDSIVMGTGELSWLVQGANVTIKMESAADKSLATVWEGYAASIEDDYSGTAYSVVLQCAGALQQPAHEPTPPDFVAARKDIGQVIADRLNSQPAKRFADLPYVKTNVTTRDRGSWESRLDNIQGILATAFNRDATLQWTVGCNPGRYPYLRCKDTTTVRWNVSVGTPGTTLQQTSDITSTTNVIFGEGVRTDGGRWRNSRYPASQPPFFEPLVRVNQNDPYTYDETAQTRSANPTYDPTRFRVARYENFGASVERADGYASAYAELARDVNPGWSGTLTLTVDPEEGSRFAIKAGDNIGLRHHHGTPLRVHHVSQVDVDVQSLTVTLTLDTNSRDAVTLAGLRARDREAATDPARRLSPPKTKSRVTPDTTIVFDAEAGGGSWSGSLPASAWAVFKVPCSAYGTIVKSAVTLSTPARFIMGLFAKPVSTSTLDSLVGPGLAGNNQQPWDANASQLWYDEDYPNSTAALQEGWGDVVTPLGYYPTQGATTPTLSGRWKDTNSVQFVSLDPPFMYVAMYTDTACTVTGRFYFAPADA